MHQNGVNGLLKKKHEPLLDHHDCDFLLSTTQATLYMLHAKPPGDCKYMLQYPLSNPFCIEVVLTRENSRSFIGGAIFFVFINSIWLVLSLLNSIQYNEKIVYQILSILGISRQTGFIYIAKLDQYLVLQTLHDEAI